MRNIKIRGLGSETRFTLARRIDFWRFSRLHVICALTMLCGIGDFSSWVEKSASHPHSHGWWLSESAPSFWGIGAKQLFRFPWFSILGVSLGDFWTCQNRGFFLQKFKTFEFWATFFLVFFESKTFKMKLQTVNIYMKYEFLLNFS